MWLLDGEPAPSDSTITRFMRGHLAEVIEDLFYQFVAKLCKIGEVKFRNLFVDGTKIEAYANKYTFVWKKAMEKEKYQLSFRPYPTHTAVITYIPPIVSPIRFARSSFFARMSTSANAG